MTARPGPQRTVVPPGTAGTSAGADAARTRRSAWTALVLLVGGLSLGVVLALVGGPWQVLAVLHLGALAIWFLVWRRSWRDLLRSAGPRSPWLLFAVGSGLCALSAVARHPIDNPGAVLAPVTPTGLLSALAMALGVGVLMNAVPEEFSLRRCLLEPLRAQFGGGFALWTTALAFVVIHLPTWISSHATASNYAAEVPEKLLFGLVAAWSVLRLDSLAFALGMHVGGNFTGVLLDSLSREETLTGWSRFTTPSVIAILAETLVTAAAVWYLGRPNRTSRPRR
ncbi:lysostaphin resistance A-like protein [Actinomyces johnsonii]|uniref:CPBP family intramembrane glutamic endopeptidase n=1 Tax=Actinomyces johnsonii TaxID=544581 RepID=UPI00040D9EC4|nr:CPBP family intramembrane glutamic endopeptidase [Actinomyces johnsonii]